MIQVDGIKFLELKSLEVDGESKDSLFEALIAVKKIDCINSLHEGCLIYVNGSNEPVAVKDSLADIRKQLTN